MREKFYIRYCDDFVIVHPSRRHLQNLIGKIDLFLKERLLMQLHPHKVIIKSWAQGIDFLGYVSLIFCTVLRTKTKRRMLARVNERNLSSYLGLLKHCHSFKLKKQLNNYPQI